ncbi:MAG: proprotein convertase P-domain-containing protein, partial [Pyrinomonadaceae bacterium]
FTLTSPGGTTIALITNRGGGGNNYCTVGLNDEGGLPPASTIVLTGGVTGNFTPESPLSAFDGQNANGNWTLNVADTAALDTGTLNRFSLIFNSGNGPQREAPGGRSSDKATDQAAPESAPESDKKEVGLLTSISNYFFGAS